MQNESMPASESMKPQSGKSSMMSKIILGVLVLALLGVGYWGYTTNSTLKATQGDLTALQAKYDKLTKDNASLTSNLAQTTTDLETTKAELEKTKEELSKSQKLASGYRASMDKALKWMDVVITWDVDDSNDVAVKKTVDATGDSKLKSLWDAYAAEEFSSANYDEWLDKLRAFERYLYESIAGFLK